ncbi:Peptidoglycan-associated lipoprotein [Sphingomonas antarctica]|uniref:peptidoglycan-associated lipoprotein Pal n=1 Tax=Sphingomonas antarctica TaxID=2040274 RepID=UPI0039EBAB5A
MTKPILTAALMALALAGCAKKPPKQLPPAPTSGSEIAPVTDTSGAATPGSQADFIAKVTSDRIFFDTDSSDVDANDQATLRSQAAWLAQYPRVRATIEGHADERGTREYNIALGDRRANSTKNVLAALGVDPGRMTVISYGKERPDATGSDEASWAKNRRAVTVTVQ